ncbi:DUF3617 family protein [Novosphingobium sp. BL-8H]|uniref:DUF3617 domain-containing protein n=1 Tax=Novosphingobium sp. BL-8H TaxID=3127640 RepID=UPI003757C3C7
MDRSRVKRRFLAASACLILMSSGFAGLADPPETVGDPITVTARKMRFTKVEYTVRGPYLRACMPNPSVGSPAADRILCSMLQQCLLEGHSGEVRAKACLDDRIHRFAEQDVSIATAQAAFDAEIGQMLASAQENTSAQGDANPRGDAPPPAESPGEITVTGSRHPIPPGLWRFVEYSTYSTSRNRGLPPAARQWQACLTEDDLHVFANALQTPDASVNSPACRSWKIRIKGKDISGSSTCFLEGGAINQGKLTGHVDADRIEVSKEVRLVVKLPKGPFFAVTRSELSAQRIGACTRG